MSSWTLILDHGAGQSNKMDFLVEVPSLMDRQHQPLRGRATVKGLHQCPSFCLLYWLRDQFLSLLDSESKVMLSDLTNWNLFVPFSQRLEVKGDREFGSEAQRLWDEWTSKMKVVCKSEEGLWTTRDKSLADVFSKIFPEAFLQDREEESVTIRLIMKVFTVKMPSSRRRETEMEIESKFNVLIGQPSKKSWAQQHGSYHHRPSSSSSSSSSMQIGGSSALSLRSKTRGAAIMRSVGGFASLSSSSSSSLSSSSLSSSGLHSSTSSLGHRAAVVARDETQTIARQRISALIVRRNKISKALPSILVSPSFTFSHSHPDH